MTYTTMKKKGEKGKWTHELTRSWSFGRGSCRILKKQPLKGGSVLFMTDITIFYMAMLGIVTNHMLFYIC